MRRQTEQWISEIKALLEQGERLRSHGGENFEGLAAMGAVKSWTGQWNEIPAKDDILSWPLDPEELARAETGLKVACHLLADRIALLLSYLSESRDPLIDQVAVQGLLGPFSKK